jgi:hypothetical protein
MNENTELTLRSVASRLKTVRADLLQECFVERVGSSERDAMTDFERLVSEARAECQKVGLQFAEYGSVLSNALKWYRAFAETDLSNLGGELRVRAIPNDSEIHATIERLERLAEEVRARQGAVQVASVIVPATNAPTSKKKEPTKIALAIAYMSEHPELQDNEIASAVGCSPEHLSRNERYKAAREAIRESGRRDLRTPRQRNGNDTDERT